MSRGPAAVSAGVILVAAGSGTRVGGALPKQFHPLAGRPLLAHSLAALLPFAASPALVVLPPAFMSELPGLLADAGLSGGGACAVAGGAARVESVANGVAALLARPHPPKFALVHDAARPFVPAELVTRLLDALDAGADCAVPVLPAAADETVAELSDDGSPRSYPRRERLARVQTPQAFRLAALADALARRDGLPHPPTDESSLLFALGYRVATVAGDPRAFKVTLPDDFARAAELIPPR